MSGPTAGDVDAVQGLKKAYTTIGIASYCAEDDYFGFFALKVVDGRESKHIRHVECDFAVSVFIEPFIKSINVWCLEISKLLFVLFDEPN